MSRLPVPGSDDGTWGSILNDFLSVSLDTDGTIKTSAVSGKEPAVTAGTTAQYYRGDKSWQTLDKSAVGLGNVDNTADAGKPISSATQTALNAKQDTSAKGAASGYAPLDGSSLLPLANLPHHASTHAPAGTDPIQPALMLPPFTQSGSLSVATGTIRLPIDSTYAVTGVRLMAGTAPAGAAIIVDILKNGSTIFTTPANRPTIAAGANSGGPGPAPDVTALSAGDYLTVNIAQVGSTTPGADLVVSILAQRLA